MRALVGLFRFLLRLQGAVIVGAQIRPREGALEIKVRRRRNAEPRCPTCGRVMAGEIRTVTCRWRHLDIWKTRTYIVCAVREGRCARHGRRIERVPWASTRARHTREFDRQVASFVRVADKTAATKLFHIAWRTVGRMVKRVVDELLPRNLLNDLQGIGVDECSYKRGHRYITIVSCLRTGRVVWVGKGRTAETLGEFFDLLGPRRALRLLVVAMDMSGGYKKAVQERAPNAEIIFDRFHVVQLLLKAIDEIRREECRKVEGESREALKGTRFALLRKPCNRTPADEEKIAKVVRSNHRLFRAYQLRVDFDLLWDITDEQDARTFILQWTRFALLSRLQPLRKFAKTLREHIEGVLGFFRWGGLTNAQLEGTCNKVKLIIHKAYGFHSVAALIAMVHLCCSRLPLPA